MVKVCPNCGKEFKLRIRNRVARFNIEKLSKQFPILHKKCLQTKDYCNACYHAEMDELVYSIRNQFFGKEIISMPEYDDYTITLTLMQGEMTRHEKVNILDVDKCEHARKLVTKGEWKLTGVDDPHSLDGTPENALKAIQAQKASIGNKRKEYEFVKYLMSQLGLKLFEKEPKLLRRQRM